MTTKMSIIQEFIEALTSEINALKKGKGSGVVTVYNGKFKKQSLDFYIYQFNLENFLVILEGSPAIIEINGTEYECDINSVNGQQIQIALKKRLSDLIPLARIKTNTWYLLELLKKKYEEHIDDDRLFIHSYKLFSKNVEKIDGGNFNPSYSDSDKKGDPDKSQKEAIFSSTNDFISIIWGPPGTGKTKTIARAIESHLNLGRKVLLLSHANNAVDQALEKVAEPKNSYYNDYKLVRLGIPKAEILQKFEKKIPLVLIDKIAEHKSKELVNVRVKLLKNLEELGKKIKDFEESLTIRINLEATDKLIQQENTEKEKNVGKIQILYNESQNQELKLNKSKKNLGKAKKLGKIKRTFLGLNPEKTQNKINEITSKIDSNIIQIRSLECKIKDSKSKLIQYDKDRRSAINVIEQKTKGYNNINEIKKRLNELKNHQEPLQSKVDKINTAIEHIKSQIILDARLVATTLSKSYLSREIDETKFDIVIVDEISMAPLPLLFWAASKVIKGITVVGDFEQLPPICVSNEEIAQRWLKKNIFDILEINTKTIDGESSDQVNLLDTQYRMHPLISEIPRTKIYNGKLNDGPKTSEEKLSDEISDDSPICLIDTTPHDPWCSQLDTGRFNLINALICVKLAEKILRSLVNKSSTIGIITPYRWQARLILKIAKDRNLLDSKKLRINTVHSFQGGEEDAIIFDCVEGSGGKRWSILNEFDNKESAKLLLNVALTRAKRKFYLLANNNFFRKLFPGKTLLLQILDHFEQKGRIIPSTKIFGNFKDENFNHWIEKINSLNERPFTQGDGFSEHEFWPSFTNDLSHIKNELIIFSPFLTIERVGKLSTYFIELISKGIKIYVITLSPNQQPAPMREDAKEVIKHLNSIGIIVKFRSQMHEKIALLDRKIKWIGSLNILSHNKKKEYMERVVGEESAKELYEKFDLENILIKSNLIGEVCPRCSDGYITIKKQRKYPYKEFYGCTNFSNGCKWTGNIKDNTYKKDDIRSDWDTQKITSSDNLNIDRNNRTEWESKTLYWSSVKKPGYRYSQKKNAWWKKK